jgi:membrane-associated phospholipid phosphatase
MIAAIIGISFRLSIDLRFISMCSILIAGFVGFARLKLNAHSPSQVYTGFLLGFLVEFLLMIFL